MWYGITIANISNIYVSEIKQQECQAETYPTCLHAILLILGHFVDSHSSHLISR